MSQTLPRKKKPLSYYYSKNINNPKCVQNYVEKKCIYEYIKNEKCLLFGWFVGSRLQVYEKIFVPRIVDFRHISFSSKDSLRYGL